MRLENTWGTLWHHYLLCAVLSGPLLGAGARVEGGLVARGRAHALVLAQTVVLEREPYSYSTTWVH